jgi:hypothetical protein
MQSSVAITPSSRVSARSQAAVILPGRDGDLRFQAEQVQHQAFTFYRLTLTPYELMLVAEADYLTVDGEEGVQRTLLDAHAKDIAQGLLNKVADRRIGVPSQVALYTEEPLGWDASRGILTVPHEMALGLLDGNHRKRAFELVWQRYQEAKDPGFRTACEEFFHGTPLNAIIFDQPDLATLRSLFVEMNARVKPVSGNVLETLMGQLGHATPADQAAYWIARQLAIVPHSPFFGRVTHIGRVDKDHWVSLKNLRLAVAKHYQPTPQTREAVLAQVIRMWRPILVAFHGDKRVFNTAFLNATFASRVGVWEEEGAAELIAAALPDGLDTWKHLLGAGSGSGATNLAVIMRARYEEAKAHLPTVEQTPTPFIPTATPGFRFAS